MELGLEWPSLLFNSRQPGRAVVSGAPYILERDLAVINLRINL